VQQAAVNQQVATVTDIRVYVVADKPLEAMYASTAGIIGTLAGVINSVT
jgi:hypothetical protein